MVLIWENKGGYSHINQLFQRILGFNVYKYINRKGFVLPRGVYRFAWHMMPINAGSHWDLAVLPCPSRQHNFQLVLNRVFRLSIIPIPCL